MRKVSRMVMSKDEKKVIFLSIIVSICFLLADTIIDSLLFSKESFWSLFLFGVSAHDIYFRTLLLSSFIAFGLVISRILSKRRQAEEMLQKHLAAMEASMDGMAILDKEGRYLYLNDAHASVYGYDRPEELIGRTWKVLYNEEEVRRLEQNNLPALLEKGQWRGEATGRRKDGSAYRQEISLTTIEGGGIVCVVRDITEQKQREDELHRSERFLNTIFDSIRDPFSILDSDYRIIRVNEAYARMKSKSTQDLIGKICYEVLENRDSVCDACVIKRTFDAADPFAKDKIVTLPDGSEVWVEIYTYPIIDEDGRVSHVIEYIRDITDRKKSEEERKHLIEELNHLSRTDSLTGLLNRRALTERLEYEVNRAKRYHSELSLILCDIDNLKAINDTYGHNEGDRALQILSGTFSELVRRPDIVGRYGGDEFMLILPETPISGAVNLAERVRTSVEKAGFKLTDEERIPISLSLGATSLHAADDDVNSLVQRSDDALYISKQTGRNKVTIKT